MEIGIPWGYIYIYIYMYRDYRDTIMGISWDSGNSLQQECSAEHQDSTTLGHSPSRLHRLLLYALPGWWKVGRVLSRQQDHEVSSKENPRPHPKPRHTQPETRCNPQRHQHFHLPGFTAMEPNRMVSWCELSHVPGLCHNPSKNGWKVKSMWNTSQIFPQIQLILRFSCLDSRIRALEL